MRILRGYLAAIVVFAGLLPGAEAATPQKTTKPFTNEEASPKQIHLRRRREFLKSFAVALAASGLADVAFGGEFGFFEVAQDFFGAFEDGFRHASKAGDLDAVAFVRSTLDNFSKEHDLVMPFAHGHVEIFQAR